MCVNKIKNHYHTVTGEERSRREYIDHDLFCFLFNCQLLYEIGINHKKKNLKKYGNVSKKLTF